MQLTFRKYCSHKNYISYNFFFFFLIQTKNTLKIIEDFSVVFCFPIRSFFFYFSTLKIKVFLLRMSFVASRDRSLYCYPVRSTHVLIRQLLSLVLCSKIKLHNGLMVQEKKIWFYQISHLLDSKNSYELNFNKLW